MNEQETALREYIARKPDEIKGRFETRHRLIASLHSYAYKIAIKDIARVAKIISETCQVSLKVLPNGWNPIFVNFDHYVLVHQSKGSKSWTVTDDQWTCLKRLAQEFDFSLHYKDQDMEFLEINKEKITYREMVDGCE